MSDAWTSATPLRNADFKALLSTPKPASLQQQQSKQQTQKQRNSTTDGEKKFKKPAPKPRHLKPKAAGEDDDDGGPKYRDRAKERRDGVNVDFADAEQELAARGLGPSALQHLSIEQSKFLGGDVAHTHLVKGLDYALLHQERQKLENDKSKTSEEAAEAAAAQAAAQRAISLESLQFHTPQGRAVFDAVFKPPQHNRLLVREMFQPRRTAFVFEFEEGSGDVPTTLRRSKADCPPVQDLVSAAADGSLLERISQIMGYIQAHAAGKAGKKSARDSQYIRSILAGVNPAAPGDAQVHGQLVMRGQAAITHSKPDHTTANGAGGAAAVLPAAAGPGAGGGDDDDDIFGEAGTDYVPEIPKKKATETGQAKRPDGGYFSNQDHINDMQQQLPPPPPQPAGDTQDVDMDIEEGEVQTARNAAAAAAGGSRYQQQQQQGYYPDQQQAAHDYYGQQGYGQGYVQQPGWQQQGYGHQYEQYAAGYGHYGLQDVASAAAAAPAPPAEQPKWRVPGKPGASSLKGFADDAYAECFPSMVDIGAADDEDEPVKEGKGAAGAAGAAAAGGKGKGGGGMDDMEKKMQGKLSREVQQMKGIFKDKGWGSELAFKKEDKFDAVAATPARKRIRL